MANYVSNWIGISGKLKDVEAFVEKAKRPYTSYYSDKEELIECDLSLWNFARPADEMLDYYFGKKTEEKPADFDTWTNEKQFQWKYSGERLDAYNWNIQHWGIGHEIYDLENDVFIDYSADKTTASVSYSFESKWSIPEPAFRAMVEQHPELSFSFESEEETGWGAKYSGEGGEFVLDESWDTPECHEDYARREYEHNCYCANYDDPHDWYDDCPDKTEMIAERHSEYGTETCDCVINSEERNLVYK